MKILSLLISMLVLAAAPHTARDITVKNVENNYLHTPWNPQEHDSILKAKAVLEFYGRYHTEDLGEIGTEKTFRPFERFSDERELLFSIWKIRKSTGEWLDSKDFQLYLGKPVTIVLEHQEQSMEVINFIDHAKKTQLQEKNEL